MWIILLIWFLCDLVGLIFLTLGFFIENHWKPKAAVKDFIHNSDMIWGFVAIAPLCLIVGFGYFLIELLKPLTDKVKCKFNRIKERVLDWCEE